VPSLLGAKSQWTLLKNVMPMGTGFKLLVKLLNFLKCSSLDTQWVSSRYYEIFILKTTFYIHVKPLGLGFTRFGSALGSTSSGLVVVHKMACQLKGLMYWPLVEIIISCACIVTCPKSIVPNSISSHFKVIFHS
jgi:hypothetical protein